MIKTLFRLWILPLFVTASLWAGDVATFVNMGFSNDGTIFFFSQYGYDDHRKEVYAQAIFVDVIHNDYTTDGLQYHSIPSIPQSGDTLDGAFLELVERLASMRKHYNVNFANKGRIIYASSVMRETARIFFSKTSENLKFRDFQDNRTFDVTLHQQITNPKASTFTIDFSITKADGTQKNYQVGSPSITRAVSHYEIDRIIVSPNGESLIFIIAMRMPTAIGTPNVRYMVEAIKIEK
ncbi:DUF2259 domain-containing protein [Entomospira entomophila]|uniref:DUF2259 domain-containing protein n=1 Tax=Entomospira entomophila TaxID=2719988 RepID=A0A968G8J9_9SPIO|nr:DUF2259 domain-containing protein [Entomospira entomophilus]NIZ40535.1 DUF2259 domain-containing protein [Entomospira entomophilus]WDI36093.1 DUF2259 domain-containing protein [Entomospira entomophilus]